MTYAFPKLFKNCLDQIAVEVVKHPHLFLFLDFDGTLVPIMNRPNECRLDLRSRSILADLHALSQVTVGIISGRKLDDVRKRVGEKDLIYAGNHGLEIEGPFLAFGEPTSKANRKILDTLVRRLHEELRFIPDAWVEHKNLSASVHFRQVLPVAIPHLLKIVKQITEPAVMDKQFILRHGKQVLEIRPAVSWNKSKALHWIVEHTPHISDPLIMYFGDDDTDEDVFIERRDIISVCVGKKSVTAAQYELETQQEMPEILEWLKRCLC
jgi:trehalose-phosphatase